MKYFYNRILKILKKILFSVYWYEIINDKKVISKLNKNYKLLIFKSKQKTINFLKKKQFFIDNNKFKRFGKKTNLLMLVKNKDIVCTGWIFFGKKWKITEVNSFVALKNTFLLFDYETPKKHRNKGYYSTLLKLIRKKFNKKKLAIYSLSYNISSKKGIEKAGFKFIKKIN